jgi:hypothetical protein
MIKGGATGECNRTDAQFCFCTSERGRRCKVGGGYPATVLRCSAFWASLVHLGIWASLVRKPLGWGRSCPQGGCWGLFRRLAQAGRGIFGQLAACPPGHLGIFGLCSKAMPVTGARSAALVQ